MPVVSQVQRIVCTNMNNFSVMLTAPAKPGKGRTSKPTDTLVFTVENPQVITAEIVGDYRRDHRLPREITGDYRRDHG